MPLLLLDWRTAAPVWQDVKIIPLMLILFHYYFLVSLVLLQVSSWEYFLTTLLTWVFSLWAFASVKHLETIFYWKRQDINKTELNLSASMRRGPKAAAVVNHMGLHSHRHLRVSTLTLILMAAVSFCRLRYPVTNPERLRMRGGGLRIPQISALQSSVGRAGQTSSIRIRICWYSCCQIPQHTFWLPAGSMLQWISSATPANVEPSLRLISADKYACELSLIRHLPREAGQTVGTAVQKYEKLKHLNPYLT